jgi:aminoglycoside 6'-N-acetyltransferase
VISFRPLGPDDLPLLRDWLARPHVARWWVGSTAEDYLPALEGREPVRHFAILLDGREIGLVETYLVADHPEWDAVVGGGPGVAGLDLFIADEELTGRGLGPQILRRFLAEVVFADPAVAACVAAPSIRNGRSLRAFEKAGFTGGPVVEDPEEGPVRVLRLERPG